jgi:glycosyltransferase involved in cell wall biosynthesis
MIGSLRLGGAQVCLRQLVEHHSDPEVTHFVYPLRSRRIDIPIRGNIITRPYGHYDIRKFFTLLKVCREEQIDIIHAHLHKAIIGALLATFFYKVKVIVHEHGSIARPGIQYSLYRLLLRLLQKRAALFIAVSQAAKRQLTQYAGVPSDRIEVVYNAVDLQTFTPKPELRQLIREEIGIGPNEVVIGFVGRLSPVKGPDILLEAFDLLSQKIPNCTLVYLGDGGMKTALFSKSIAMGLDNRVKFLGFRENIAEIMNIFDIGCISSRQEAFGIAAIEYMSMKIPLVSCNIYGLAEVVIDKHNALVPQKNAPLEICNCLEQLIKDEKLRLSLIKGGFCFVQTFDVSELVNKINRIYSTISK